MSLPVRDLGVTSLAAVDLKVGTEKRLFSICVSVLGEALKGS